MFFRPVFSSADLKNPNLLYAAAITVLRYSFPLDRTAHAMRASLLATATTTWLRGARRSRSCAHCSNRPVSPQHRRNQARAPATACIRLGEFPVRALVFGIRPLLLMTVGCGGRESYPDR